MMRRTNPTYRRFAAAKQGVAAVEFALILPILVVMLLATFDGGRAIAAYMKMRAATYALASITNQYSTIQAVDMTAILGATSVVMAPYSSGSPAVIISQIKINNTESLKSNGAPPKTPPRVRLIPPYRRRRRWSSTALI